MSSVPSDSGLGRASAGQGTAAPQRAAAGEASAAHKYAADPGSAAQQQAANDSGSGTQKRAAGDSGSAAQKRAAGDSGSAAQKRAAEWAVRPERSNTVALRFMAWMALHVGRAPARALLPPICLYYMLFAPKVRAASKEFLTHALGRAPTTRDYYLHLHTFACTILDRVFLLNDQFERFDVKVHGREVMDEFGERGEGCFLLGAHLGSFEVLRTLARVSKGLDVSLVMYENNARKVNEVLNAINPNLAVEVIGLGNADAMLKVEEALERGRAVGMLGDRNFADEGVVPVTFFGRTTHCPIGPFRMAAILRRPMVLMFGLYRGGNRYDLHFERLPDVSQVPRAERAKAIEQSLQNYVERLEHYCRLAPYNWFNYYAFWEQGKPQD